MKKPCLRVGDRVTYWPYSWFYDRRTGVFDGLGKVPRPEYGHGTVVRAWPRRRLCYEVELDTGPRVLATRGDLGFE